VLLEVSLDVSLGVLQLLVGDVQSSAKWFSDAVKCCLDANIVDAAVALSDLLLPQGNTYLLLPQGNTYLLLPQGNTYLLLPQGNTYLLRPQGNTYLLLPQGNTTYPLHLCVIFVSVSDPVVLLTFGVVPANFRVLNVWNVSKVSKTWIYGAHNVK